ncbi:MAG: class I tRNA ligase family protein, partial [Bacillota bacterium]
FTLIMGNTPGNDIRFRDERLEASRNFGNKLWNASRFVIMNLDGFSLDSTGDVELLAREIEADLTLADRWIRSRANKIAKEVSDYLKEYEIGEAARTLYNFTWDEFCDWYIEIAKSRLYSDNEKARRCAQYVLWETLKKTVKLLHPFIPFITERIWRLLPETSGSVVVADWPRFDDSLEDPEAEAAMGIVMDTVRAIRNIRSEMNVPPQRKIEAVIVADRAASSVLEENSETIGTLSGLSSMVIKEHLDIKPEKAASQIIPGAEIYVPLKGVIDLDVEIRKLEKGLDATLAAITRSQEKLSNKGFLEKAREEVVEKEREKLSEYLAKEERLQKRLKELKE